MLLAGLTLTAQTKHSMQGKVICKTTDEPVMMATVVMKELNIWATTTEAGDFELRNIPEGTYTSLCHALAICSMSEDYLFPLGTEKTKILIDEATLAIDDVVVTAKEGRRWPPGQ